MIHENLSALDARRRTADKAYLEFLRAESLSLGLYFLPAGANDPQQPHTEDEVYCVLSGRARFQAGDDDEEIGAGSVLFVEAGIEHRFHAIVEDPTVLVFFAPAEGTGS